MKTVTYEISAKVWLYPGKAGWCFVTIEKDDASKIKKEFIWPRRGFGAIPVFVTLGKIRWKTSLFPEKEGTYLLPIKRPVRIQEKIAVGDVIDLTIEVIN